MKLYGYWRSSAAYRVRIAMHIKGIEFESIPVHLVKDGGEQHKDDYVQLNPTHLVPTLVDGELTLNQSLSILDYLDEVATSNPLVFGDAKQKALIRALALDVACEIHPVNNLRVQQYLVNELAATDAQKLAWTHYWMTIGFKAIEEKVEYTRGKYCFGDQVSLADICLVPQVYNAVRFKLDMSQFPNIQEIVNNCNQLPAFIAALPENQADTV